MCCPHWRALNSAPLYLVFEPVCILSCGPAVYSAAPLVYNALVPFAISRVRLCLRVGVRVRGGPAVYMDHSLRNHNPTFEPIYSQGGFTFPCLAELMATSIMTSPQHPLIGWQTAPLSANPAAIW